MVVIQSEGGQSSSTPLEMDVSEVVSQVAKVEGKSVSYDSDFKSPPKQAQEKPTEERRSAPILLEEAICLDLVSLCLCQSQSDVDQPAWEKKTLTQARIPLVQYLRPRHKAPLTSKESISTESISSEPDDHDESGHAASNMPCKHINATR